ncbi:MAG: 4Fe-4S ferredoxin [Chloroflexi bacterium]|jgi:MinD superfamily P-loop ATPase|nr:4Fe-4S ferredoxin [Chloroflexota bacterium]MBT7081271.1 4Fe-4S ferredoxin [Chloroflexota bacterium]MBT7288894.1 4Fe-4S ferredoxin [Chloroflexota bacterium]
MAEMPYIDLDKCDSCALCIPVCRCGALVLVNNVITLIETEKCGWCCECEEICPLSAITCAFEIVFADE